MKEQETQRAEKAALRLIARAEQCSNGLQRKLERKGFEPAAVSEVIAKLLQLKLVDDDRYARLWLTSRLRLTRTPRRLIIALCAKGIERSKAEDSLNAAMDEETEWDMLWRFAKKQQKKAAKKGDTGKNALKYLLRNEGFSKEVIARFFETAE